MSNIVLSNNFSAENWLDYFDSHSNYFSSVNKSIAKYQDENFTDIVELGKLELPDGNEVSIHLIKTSKPLTERAYRRRQFEKAVCMLKETNTQAGLFVIYDSSFSFRFSLVYPIYKGTKREFSNYRRYTFYLKKGAQFHTYEQQIGSARFDSLKSIKDAFALEPVTKEFYTFIAQKFSELVGGERKIGSRNVTFDKLIVYPGNDHVKEKEFAVRLMGRLIFCWFLKKKTSDKGIPLISDNVLSIDIVRTKHLFSFYHSILEPLFFEVLNKDIDDREQQYQKPPWNTIPFLNGGLFDSDEKDFYKIDELGNSLFLNTLKIPDHWFIELFEGFERYNFTVDESSSIDIEISIDPEMLGRVFENLLAEINPETGETARKSTGSYYTPRAIVDYMVDQSVILYLCDKTGFQRDLIESIVSNSDSNVEYQDTQKKAVIESLDSIRILDPACGSGAFLMGLLHRMLFIIKKIDPDLEFWKKKLIDSIKDSIFKDHILKQIGYGNFEYIIKLGLIRNSIFGIDIQPIAVEISKLRLFLSLIVDEMIDDRARNRGIISLPNLEFKIVAANSLIDLPLDVDSVLVSYIYKLANLKNEYFSADSKRKAVIVREYLSVRDELAIQAEIWQDKNNNLLKLVAWNPFTHDLSDWFDPKWMFGFEKFDIIIANPPYIGEKGHKDLFRPVKDSSLGVFYQGKMDIFYFFFSLALNLTKINGVIALISTNYFITATGASKLRSDLQRRSVIHRLLNFNELKIFESATGQHNMISILKHGRNDNTIAETMITRRSGLSTQDLIQSILYKNDTETDYYSSLNVDLYDDNENYIRLTNFTKNTTSIDSIFTKMKDFGVTLCPTIVNINCGVQTGADKVSNHHTLEHENHYLQGDGIFILDVNNYNDQKVLSTFNSAENELVKTVYKNSDIRQYICNETTSLRLLYIDRSIKSLDCYPNIEKHLSKYRDILSKRREVENGVIEFFQIQWPRDKSIFLNSKIVAPQRSSLNTFGYSEIPWYASVDVYYITQKKKDVSLKYLLALLNSKLYYLWLYHKGKRKGEALELYQKPLSEIPIKNVSKEEQAIFVRYVNEILKRKSINPNSDVSDIEGEIDQLVYKLYGLSAQEIKIVEKFKS